MSSDELGELTGHKRFKPPVSALKAEYLSSMTVSPCYYYLLFICLLVTRVLFGLADPCNRDEV